MPTALFILIDFVEKSQLPGKSKYFLMRRKYRKQQGCARPTAATNEYGRLSKASLLFEAATSLNQWEKGFLPGSQHNFFFLDLTIY
jgi:hypothetical protein